MFYDNGMEMLYSIGMEIIYGNGMLIHNGEEAEMLYGNKIEKGEECYMAKKYIFCFK